MENANWVIQAKHTEVDAKTVMSFLKECYDLIKEGADGDDEHVVNCCKNILEHIGFIEISEEEDETYNGTFEGFRYYGLVLDGLFVTQFFEEHSLNIKFREKTPIKEIQPKRREVISKVPLEFELLHANLKVDEYEDQNTESE
jgi:hypothetical protein